MASLRQLRSAPASSAEERFGFDDYVQWLNYAGSSFPTYGATRTMTVAGQPAELPDGLLGTYAAVLKTNGIVFACMAIRQRIFSEVTFRFANVNNGKVGKLFGTAELGILEHPWPNGTTGELAARMICDVDLAGNFFAVRQGSQLYRRSPDAMTIVLNGDPLVDEYADIVGYLYQPSGAGGPTYTYAPNQVCHWSPLPDPLANYRGMSWLTPVLREIRADNSATDHKAKFFANGATPNMVVKFPPDVMTKQQFEEFKAKMDAAYTGTGSAYKTLYLAPGADVEVVGHNFEQMDFSNTQGRDETRIASAAGVPPVVVGLKESLAGSSLNAGNFQAARRSFADGTMRPLYRSAAAALETIVPPPNSGSRLWFDDSGVAFFREDQDARAKIAQTGAQTIKSYIDAGFEPESVIAAAQADDLSLLVHSGLYSVQLQPPGTSTTTPPANGGTP